MLYKPRDQVIAVQNTFIVMKASTDVLRKLLSFQCRNWKSNRVRGVFVVIRTHAVKKTKHPGAVRDSAKIGAVFRTKYPWITNSVAVV